MKENGKTQEEIDVENQVIENKIPTKQSQPELLSEEPKIVKKPFIPSLKTETLGFSNLVKEGGKTQEEIDVESQVKSNQI